MGSYTFTWAHPNANEVFVTGDFDDWKTTIKLDKEDGVFKKTVELEKKDHQYKFVVDGNWVTNEAVPTIDDGKGNFNNILRAESIQETVHTLSSVAPESTTAALAGAVPKEGESKTDGSLPGTFPETPATEPNAFSVNPIPATEGPGNPIKLAPGEPVPDPSTLTSNTIQSTVKDEKPEEKPEEVVSVAPIPATEGLGNPIHLAPGEKVPDPSTLTSNTIQSTVKDEKPEEAVASTEDAVVSVAPIPATEGLGNPIHLAPGEKVPDPSTLTSNTIQSTVKDAPEEEKVSVAPIPATAGAGNPIHLAPGEKVPDPSTLTSNTISSTVKTDADSYEKSDALPPQLGPVVTPEAEREANGGMFSLPPVTSNLIPESSLPKDTNAKTEQDPGVTIQSVAPTSTTAALAGAVPKEPKGVPEAVTASQKEADFAPEASANPVAVEEKKEVEEELKEKVPEEPPVAESSTTEKVAAGAAAGATAAAGAFAAATYSAKEKAAETLGMNGQTTAAEVPAVVTESQKEAHASPEAAANAEVVEEKKEVENELLKEVKKTDESGEPAPTVTAATSATAPGLSENALSDAKPLESSSEPNALNASASKPAEPETAKPALDSRDVSPMTKQPTAEQTQPIVTTGADASKTEAKTTAPEAPKNGTTEPSKDTPAAADDKKKKRRSFFGRIKDKLKHLD